MDLAAANGDTRRMSHTASSGDAHFRAVNERTSEAARLHREGRTEAALEKIIEACDVAIDRAGPRSASFFAALQLAASLQGESGNTVVGIGLCRRAIRLAEEMFGPHPGEAVVLLNNLAGLQLREGDLDAAEATYAVTLHAFEEHGTSRELLATLVHSMGFLRFARNDMRAAKVFYERAAAIRREIADRSPALAETLNNLGDIQSHLGDHQGAADLYEESHRISRRFLDDTHPLVLIGLSNQAAALHRAGRLREAEPLYRRTRKSILEQGGEIPAALNEALDRLARDEVLPGPPPPTPPARLDPLAPLFQGVPAGVAATLARCCGAFFAANHGEVVRAGLEAASHGTARHDLYQLVLLSLERLGARRLWKDLRGPILEISGTLPWHHALLRLTLGESSAGELQPLVRDDGMKGQLAFYTACRLAAAGRRSEARSAFDAARGGRPKSLEWFLATADRLTVGAETAGGRGWADGGESLDDAVRAMAREMSFLLRRRSAGDLHREGRDREAIPVLRGLLASFEESTHTSPGVVSSVENDLANIHFALGDDADALLHYQRCLELVRGQPAQDRAALAALSGNIANALRRLGRSDEAVEHHEAAAAYARADAPEGSPREVIFLLDHAQTERERGDPARSAALYRGASECLLRGLGAPLARFAQAVARRVGEVLERGALEEARLVLIEANAVWEAATTDSSDPSSLSSLADALVMCGDEERAERFLRRALELLESRGGGDKPLLASILVSLARLRLTATQLDEAEEHVGRALAALGGDDAPPSQTLVRAIALQSQLHNVRGALPEALAAGRRALDVAEQLSGTQSESYAARLLALSRLEHAAGRGDDARLEAEEALAVLRGLGGHNHAETATALHVLASLAHDEGRLEDARRLLHEALEPARIAGDGVYTENLAQSARLGIHEGNLTQAAADLDAAAALFEASGSRGVLEAASLELDRARLLLAAGDAGGAESSAASAVRAFEGAAPDGAQLGFGLVVLAHCQSALGKRHASVPTLSRAIELFRRVLGHEHPLTAGALMDLGHDYVTIGAHETAVAFLTEARSAFQAIGRGGATGVLRADLSLWMSFHAKRDHERALEVALSSLDHAERALGADHPMAIEARRCLADTQAALGRFDEAIRQISRIIDAQHRYFDTVARLATDTHLRAALRDAWGDVDRLVSLAMQAEPLAPVHVELVCETLLRRKGLSVDLGRRALFAMASPQAARLADELRDLRARIAEIEVSASRDDDWEERQGTVAKLEARARERERRLARGLEAGAIHTWLQTVRFSGVAGALAEGTALVEIVAYEAIDLASGRVRNIAIPRARRYIAFVITPDGRPPTLRDLGPAVEIDALVERLLDALAPGESARDTPDAEGFPEATPGGLGRRLLNGLREFVRTKRSGAEAPWRAVAEELRRRLVDPVRGDLGAAQRVFVAPDGELGRVPFEALPVDGGRHLGRELDICYLTCGRELLERADPGRPAGPPLIIADPDYDLGDRAAGSEEQPYLRDAMRAAGVRFSRLPGTREEGSNVASLLGVPALMGPEALEARLHTSQSPRVLHIATHGYYLPAAVDTSPPDVFEKVYLVDVPGEGLFLSGLERRTPARSAARSATMIDRLRDASDPLVRCGLALAGANTYLVGGRLPVAAEDGILTAADAATLDLRGTRLVVLSACQTGMGEVRSSGEGVFGLRRALRLAGARTMIVSLWRVGDRETAQLMDGFYRRLLEGATVSEALRGARSALEEAGAGPRSWAAFVVVGDGFEVRLSDSSDGNRRA